VTSIAKRLEVEQIFNVIRILAVLGGNFLAMTFVAPKVSRRSNEKEKP